MPSAWNKMRKNWCWHTLTEWNELILNDITFITWQKRYSCFHRRNGIELTFSISKNNISAFFWLRSFSLSVFSLSTRLAANQILWKPAALSHYCLAIKPSFLGAVTFPFYLLKKKNHLLIFTYCLTLYNSVV